MELGAWRNSNSGVALRSPTFTREFQCRARSRQTGVRATRLRFYATLFRSLLAYHLTVLPPFYLFLFLPSFTITQSPSSFPSYEKTWFSTDHPFLTFLLLDYPPHIPFSFLTTLFTTPKQPSFYNIHTHAHTHDCDIFDSTTYRFSYNSRPFLRRTFDNEGCSGSI